MIAWNAVGRFLVTKGENVDVKHLGSKGTLVPAFFAFDILYLNDRTLTGLPYKVNSLLEQQFHFSNIAIDEFFFLSQ